MQTSSISLSSLFGMQSPSVVKEAFYELRLCGVVHGSRRAGFFRTPPSYFRRPSRRWLRVQRQNALVLNALVLPPVVAAVAAVAAVAVIVIAVMMAAVAVIVVAVFYL